tara:strand:+ start:1554 stop:2207 length:654 start_codon:yes stop_codon:yes gene_type:complete
MATKDKDIDSIKHAPGEMIPYDNPEEVNTEIISSRCKLCNSKNKEEAEALYDQRHNMSMVQRFLDKKGEKISQNAIAAHMKNHFGSSKTISGLKWFDRDVGLWDRLPYNREQSIRRWISILTRELHILGSQSDALSLEDRRRNVEQVRKIVETLANCDSKLNELQEQKEPVQLIFKQLNIIVQDKLKENDNPQVRTFIVDVLEKLQQETGDMVVGEQ